MSRTCTNTLTAIAEKSPTLEFVHYHWVDYMGVLRARVLTISHARDLEASNRLVRVTPVCSFPLHGGRAHAGFIGAAGFNTLVPDWESLVMLSKTHASVMCDISEESVYHPGFDTSKPFERCPRTQLRHILERASEDLNIELLAGLELEFYLISLRESDDEEHIEDHLGPLNDWSTASGLRSGEGNCVEACVQRLQKSGICVEQYHKEGGFRQFEISLGPLPVLCAADKCMQSQEIIKRTAISHGYKATFFPRPFPNRDPSGSHVHLSMTDTTLKPNIEKQIEPDHFLAGILENLPLLCAFSLGSEASYSRVEQGTMGEWVAWGTENRHVPIRRISYQHWEIRCIDSTSNLYLAIGAFIAAGLVGMKGNTPLRWGDCKEHIRNLSEQTKTDLGIVTAMPKDTGSALALLEENVELLDNYVPLELVRLYSILRRKEHNAYAKMSEIQRRSAYLRDY